MTPARAPGKKRLLLPLGVLISVLLLFAMSFRKPSQPVPECSNGPVVVAIKKGRLIPLPERAADPITRNIRIDVCANQHIQFRFKSEDFVYTVQIMGSEYAQVVLPGGTAQLDVILRAGTFELKLVQGCGKLSPAHAQVIYLNAIPG